MLTALLFSVGGLAFAMRFEGAAWIVVVGGSFALGLATTALLVASHRRNALVLANDELVHQSLWRKRVVARRGDRVVRLSVEWPAAGSANALVVWVDAEGRTTGGLNERAWDRSRLDALFHALDLRTETIHETLDPATARRRYPGTIPWASAHPTASALILIAALSIVIALLQTR